MSPGIRVLLIEDDPDDALLAREYLGEAAGDYEVTWEGEPGKGIERLVAVDAHDVCLLDYQLGSLTGLQVLAEARKRGSQVPVIMLTGTGDPLVDLNATVGGASDFMEKREMTARALERAIRYAIARKRDERRLKAALNQVEVALAQVEEAHEQLRQKNEELTALGEFKERILGIAAHDLRTPLSAITGWLFLLGRLKEGETLSDRQQNSIERIQGSLDYMLNLVNELLDRSALEAGAVQLRPQLIEPRGWIETLVSRHMTNADAKQIELRLELGDLPSAVAVDPVRLEQAVSNLVSNAIKFSPPSTIVEVRAHCHDDRLEIDVVDEGPGIASEHLERIFEPFAHVRVAETEEKSSGLGLTIARQIADAHGGTLNVASDVKAGTTFSIRVPTGNRPLSMTSCETA